MDEVIIWRLADTGFGDFPECRKAKEGSQVQLCNSLETVQPGEKSQGEATISSDKV